ncbi:MAG: hypothetical protein H0U38_10840 [Chloroflexia bacterium]|jgi:hypothetical protein|nr:hypothetical protein [Chloroflexia bacterium]MDQ3613127.1 hypothetical protein [Chloroflexota bacterium]
MNEYTVRYQLDGEEFTDRLEADNAASAARLVEDRHFEDEERFELIEVHMVEDEQTGADVPSLEQTN